MRNSSLSLVELSPLLSISPTQAGLLWGVLVSVTLAVVSFFALRWAVARSYGTFLNVLFGSMLARLVVIGGAMIWAWRFSTMNALAFTITVLAGYVVFQIIEVFVAQKQVRSARLARPAGK